MFRLIKPIYIFITIALLVIMAACSTAKDVEQVSAGGEPVVAKGVERVSAGGEPVAAKGVEQVSAGGEPVAAKGAESVPVIESSEDYYNYIAGLPKFEAYYQIVFEFGNLPDGIESAPIDDILNMYDELNTVFDCVNIRYGRPIEYIGFYDGDTKFVDRDDWYRAGGSDMGFPDPLNRVWSDVDGNEHMTTPIRTVILCENSFGRFDNYIAAGRNLQISDFKHTAADEPIPVVLGSAYQGVYDIGDALTFTYLSVDMDFEVVGFYEPGLSFYMGPGAQQYVEMDYSIIMPNYIPAYEPTSAAVAAQQGFHVAELTSVDISISELISEINDETHERYFALVEEIAERNNLSGMYMSPLWPVGYVFPN
ncbi:MAG: hypothetical protein LBD92_00030 [Oscillospiraceae bacterium]|jgi:hypothetical protein|nr:hypothetical protein [Oscillospiraceae bacterium]